MAAAATDMGRNARARLRRFSIGVWAVGLAVCLFAALLLEDDGRFNLDGLSDGDEYAQDPWLREDPLLATDLGDARFEGQDTAMIPLTGLDPAEPVLIRELDSGYVSQVRVTGPGGEILVEGEYGDPPRFSTRQEEDAIVVIVPQPDVELWVTGSEDEPWRVEVGSSGIPTADAVMSGFGPGSFLLDTGATTARLTARGEGSVGIDVATVHGSEPILSVDAPAERSFAWQDAPLVHFDIDAWGDTGWRIEFAEGE